MSNTCHYNQLFEYLSAESLPTEPEPLVVFGRNDALVTAAAGELITANLAQVVAISGGVGKDTGDLLDRGFRSEADFLFTELLDDASKKDYDLPRVLLDEHATNGGDNARNSLDLLIDNGFAVGSLTAVAHATSARRLAATLEFEGAKKTGKDVSVHVAPSDYEFNAENPTDQAEAVAEMTRLYKWSESGTLGSQADLPQDLIDFALDHKQWIPGPPSPLVSALIGKLPPQLQVRLLQTVDRLSHLI